jgi:hypothetical protein
VNTLTEKSEKMKTIYLAIILMVFTATTWGADQDISTPRKTASKVSPVVLATDANPVPWDLTTPEMTDDEPAPGKRVRQVAVEYKGTDVYHALYLPRDWKPTGKYPVIVEYTGNQWAPCGSTGEQKDANLGYGMSGGQGFIWVVMPFVSKDQNNMVGGFGDKKTTADYCKVNLPRICKQFGGDTDNLFICGFSRGALAASSIGLADDEIAALWKGMFTHDHFCGENGVDQRTLKILARLKGRPVLACGGLTDHLKDHLDLARFTFLKPPVEKLFKIPEGKVIHTHTDLWMHKESEYRQQARAWIAGVLKENGQKGNAPESATHADSTSQSPKPPAR